MSGIHVIPLVVCGCHVFLELVSSLPVLFFLLCVFAQCFSCVSFQQYVTGVVCLLHVLPAIVCGLHVFSMVVCGPLCVLCLCVVLMLFL